MFSMQQSLVPLMLCALFLANSSPAHAQTPRTSSGTGTSKTSGTSKVQPRGTTPPTNVPRQAAVPGNLPGRATVPGTGARPTGQPFRIKKVSPEVDALLREWEERTSELQRLEGKFTKFSYDDVFQVEKRAVGSFCFQSPDKGAFVQTGNVPSNEKVSRKVDPKTGKAYGLEKDIDLRWVCDGEQIMMIKEAEKEYDSTTIPLDQRGQNIVNAPLPFVFGMKAESAKQRYEIEILAEKSNASQVWLVIKPLWHVDQLEWQTADVILDRKTFLPKAVRLLDPAGTKQSTYAFDQTSMKVNQRSWAWLTGDPLKPNLRGYKQNISSPGVEGEVPQQSRGDGEIQLAPRPSNKRSATVPTQAPQRSASVPSKSRTN